MVLKKSSLHNRNEFLISCQKCSRIKSITPADVERSDQIFKIFGMKGFYIYQCECGARFNVQLDFRSKHRHNKEIGSCYTTLTKSSEAKGVGAGGQSPYKTIINSVIKNISVDGIGFVTYYQHNIGPGDELLVKLIFKRGQNEQQLERRVIVRTVTENYIGAEFFDEDKKSPEIGFFLMDD